VIARPFTLLTVIIVLVAIDLHAQTARPGARIPVRSALPQKQQQMKRASELIHRQEPINVSPRLL
jgi:hypothetical protein